MWDYMLLFFQTQVSSGPIYDFDINAENNSGSYYSVRRMGSKSGMLVFTILTIPGSFELAEYSGSKSAAWSPVENLVAIEKGNSLEILKFGAGTVEASATLPEKVNRVAWSPTGKLIATAGQDGILRLWSVGGGTSLSSAHTFEQDAEITALAWSPDGDRIAAGDANGYVWVWQVP